MATEIKKHNWKFCQVFGDRNMENVQKADIISALEFDKTGDYLAAGDNGGRLVLFNIVKNAKTQASRRKVEYNFITEFQSHEPDFDHLRSLEIEERINSIKFLPHQTSSHILLTTNDKVIKLWKVYNSPAMTATKTNKITDASGRILAGVNAASLHVPTITRGEDTLLSINKRQFAAGHTYNINSLSVCSDNEMFLTSDDLRVNLWNIEKSDTCYNIVDIKPDNMEDITQIITCAAMHPVQPSLFLYATSKGLVRLCDMRRSALADTSFTEFSDSGNTSFATSMLSPAAAEMVSFICDAQFSPDGKSILTRDFFTLRLWDIRMLQRPSHAMQLHEPFRNKLL
ncbi:MAG: putative Protein phosphatase PP2A regulatory subunit B, partial [Streblomastix strix]